MYRTDAERKAEADRLRALLAEASDATEARFYRNGIAIEERRYGDLEINPVVDQNIGAMLTNPEFVAEVARRR